MPDIVVPEASLPEGGHRHPHRRVHLEVTKLLRGNVERQFKIWQTGNDTVQLVDDPPYRVGEAYVLFLRPVDNEPGTYVHVGPPGRFRALNNKLELMPRVVNVPFAAALAGKSVSELEQALSRDEAAGR